MGINLTPHQSLFFRDALREARGSALLNAEGYEPIIVALERLGSFLVPKGTGFGQYKAPLLALAGQSVASALPQDVAVSPSLDCLFEMVRVGRNDAVHEGAHARHLVRHCVELSLHVEEGLMSTHERLADFMVRSPVTVEPWQPVAYARQEMLINSFSFLPIRIDGAWYVISDKAIAKYVAASVAQGCGRIATMKKPIGEVVQARSLTLEQPDCFGPETPLADAVKGASGSVVLVVQEDRLLGIATFFDFL